MAAAPADPVVAAPVVRAAVRSSNNSFERRSQGAFFYNRLLIDAVQPITVEVHHIRLTHKGIIVPELQTGIDHDLDRVVLLGMTGEIDHPQLDGIEDEVFIARPDARANAMV